MKKYLRVIIKCLPLLIWSYGWIFRYSRHPEKYDLNLRFKKVQNLIKKVLDAFNVRYEKYNFDSLQSNCAIDNPNLFVCNHISDIDPLVFIALANRPIAVVAKKEIKSYPFVGRVITILNGVFLDREDLKQSLRIFKEIGNTMNEIKTMDWLIFPEGTRNKIDPTDTKPFHYGTFKPAMKNMLNINVFSILGSQRALNYKCKNKINPVFIKYNSTLKYDYYKDMKTVELSEEAYKICRAGVQSLIQDDKDLLIKYNKKN